MAEPTYEDLCEEVDRLREERESLERRIEEQDRRIREQGRRIGEQERELKRLAEALERAQRARKRQAAPFSKGTPKRKPKRPGRKSGRSHGRHGHRPRPDRIDEVHEAEFPCSCPDCGGRVEETAIREQYQVEVPRRPIHRRFNVHIGHCVGCGKRVQGRHPLQASDALGAAASQVGPEAQAAMVDLNKRSGLSHGKVVDAMEGVFGIRLARSTSARIMLRAAKRAEPIYRSIVNSSALQLWNVADETGWRVGGSPAWLHVFVSERLTCCVTDAAMAR